jgi:transposase InsO family protein
VVDYVKAWSEKTEIPVEQLVGWLGIGRSKFYDWRSRYGKANEHNCQVPRDFWLEPWETEAILRYQLDHPIEGYRRLAFMMLDEDIVAVSPASVWRVLDKADRLRRHAHGPSSKGKGFQQPDGPHQHWHIDISYLKVAGTFYYLCTVLDGYSRFVVHWDIRERMTTKEIEIIVQRARERFPGVKPRIVSDNGPQFIAKEFKEFIRLCEMQHVRISPGYPQSNGKIEVWHKTLKSECIRPQTPLSLEDAFRVTDRYVTYYNTVRLHAALGYVTPADRLAGRHLEIWTERDRKLEAARERRRIARTKLLSSAEGCAVVGPQETRE